MEQHDEIKLSDLLDINTLQTIQDSLSQVTGMAAITTDANGVPVTNPSKFTEFCSKYTRSSILGCEKCQKCDRFNANNILDDDAKISYFCHAGLIEFGAPILAYGKLVGCFIGGQVLLEPLKEDFVRETARQIGIDPDQYWEAAKKIPVVTQEEIDKAADFLFKIANVISDMAYGKYIALKGAQEIEHAAKLKTDFLANMSHEIRTPMNAVIGMAELALRENLSPAAQNYITQIKNSGKALLAIINDILDFSKIESGKMDITIEEYEPLSLINDVANIIMTRLENKDVELILDINPTLPEKLLGDSIRLRQILINLLNNATKFTNHGHVKLSVDYQTNEFDEILLQICVEDTGIGIHEDDLGKIFKSFQQVDAKRNRNIEGTGLGLTITKRLLALMNGKIWVESQYGKGSSFYFYLPQEVSSSNPAIKLKEPEKIVVAGLFHTDSIKNQFIKDVHGLKVPCKILKPEIDIEKGFQALTKMYADKNIFFYIEETLYTEHEEEIFKKYPQIIGILITDFYSKHEYNLQNMLIVKKPLSVLSIAMLLNKDEDFSKLKEGNADTDFGFIAPDANILVVDDNNINITVTQGLLEPLQMHVDAALSGKEAINMIQKKKYDLIFMDHMMPEMDGVEATMLIRQKHPNYANVPIIALTANAVGNVKELFLRAGMNDFVAKPIELRLIVSKVRQWLPQNKIIRQTLNSNSQGAEESQVPIIGDLDTKRAIKLLGSESLFWTVLKEFYRVIMEKALLIRNYEKEENWEQYTIEVHALKSASKQIGAMELSEKAARLEKAGNEKDANTIHISTDDLLKQYGAYISVLEPFCGEREDPNIQKEPITKEILLSQFEILSTAVDELDMDAMEQVSSELNKHTYSNNESQYFHDMKVAIENIDVTKITEIMDEWKKFIEQ